MTSADSRRRHRVNQVLLAALCVFLGLLSFFFLATAACFNAAYREGSWSDLGAMVALMTLIPAIAVVCLILALSLLLRGATPVHRGFAWGALTLAFLLGCPVTNFQIAVAMSLPAALILKPSLRRGDAGDRSQDQPPLRPERRHATRPPQTLESPKSPNPLPPAPPPEPPKPPDPVKIASHYKTFERQFGRPQPVSRAENGLLVLEDRKVLRLYGVHLSMENAADLSNYASGSLAHRQVMIRLPDLETFAKTYRPEAGDRFGTIPAYVYVDGVLLNARYRTTPGSLNDFGEYEKAPAPRPDERR